MISINISNTQRFETLRGYYQKGLYHPRGGEGIVLKEILIQLGFNGIKDFQKWYKKLDKKSISDQTIDWCSGNCCNSILSRLLSFNPETKLS